MDSTRIGQIVTKTDTISDLVQFPANTDGVRADKQDCDSSQNMADILSWSGNVGHMNSASKLHTVGVKNFDDIYCNKSVYNYNNNNKHLTDPGWQDCTENRKDLDVDNFIPPELVVKIEPEEDVGDPVTRSLTEHDSDSLDAITVHFQSGNNCVSEPQNNNSSWCRHSALQAVKTKPEKRNVSSSLFPPIRLRAQVMRQGSNTDVSFINTAGPQKTGPVPVKLLTINSTLGRLNQDIPNDTECNVPKDTEYNVPNDTECNVPNDTECNVPNHTEVNTVSIPESSTQVASTSQSRSTSCKTQCTVMQSAKSVLSADLYGGDLNQPASGPSCLSDEVTGDPTPSSMFIYSPQESRQDRQNLTQEKQKAVGPCDQQSAQTLTAKQREAARQRQRRYIQNLTPEQREAVKQRERQRYWQYRETLTEEQREVERQRYKTYRQNMTPEQREKDRQRQQRRKQNMTPEQRAAAKQRQQERRQNMTQELLEAARQRQRQYQRQYQQRRHQNSTPEQVAAAREYERERQKRRTQNLTPEQREAARLRTQKYRQKLTQEKQEAIRQSQKHYRQNSTPDKQ